MGSAPDKGTVQLGLGTAQFGSAYGATNTSGELADTDLDAILKHAHDRGVRTIDTAAAYGNSEERLGQRDLAGFRLITKLAPMRLCPVSGDPITFVESSFESSLKRLGVPGVDAVLVHDAQDLLGANGGQTADMLRTIRQDGKALKTGVSVYDKIEIEALAPLFDTGDLSMVQLPLNLFDRRLLDDGTLGWLAQHNVEIHVRSAFLQGVLLADPKHLPAHLAPLSPAVAEFQYAAREQGHTPLSASLSFLRGIGLVDTVVIGVLDPAQLGAACDAMHTGSDFDASGLALPPAEWLDPRQWPAKC